MIATLIKAGDTWRRRIDYAFLFLCSYVLLINIPYFFSSFVPRHDSMFIFEVFYYFYNEFFHQGVIAQWSPYEVYGLPTGPYQIAVLTPASYLFFLVGKFFQIKNVFLIFKLSIVFEQLVFLTGLYRLAKLLLKAWPAVLLTCLAAFCSLEWTYQLWWNFRLYYLFPWVLYFIVLFFRSRRSFFFWMSGIIFLLWAYGICWYPPFLWVFLMVVICAVLFFSTGNAWRNLWPRHLLDGLLMCLFCIFLGTMFYFFKSSFQDLTPASRPSGIANSLSTFLTYGGTANLDSIISCFFLGWPIHSQMHFSTVYDNTIYVGMATVVFFVWAVLFVRDKYFYALLAGTVALIGLSFGGLWAKVVYFFPGMKYFRHIALTYALIKTLVAIGSGFGFLHFWKCPETSKLRKTLLTIGACLLLIVMSPTSLKALFTIKDHLFIALRLEIYFLLLCVWAIVWSIVTIASRQQQGIVSKDFLRNFFGALIILALLADSFIFQKALHAATPAVLKQTCDLKKEIMAVHKPEFSDQRVLQPVTSRQKKIFLLEEQATTFPLARYDTVFSFAQLDSCNVGRTGGLVTSGARSLLRPQSERHPIWKKIVGCQASKLRLLKTKPPIFYEEDLDRPDVKGEISISKFSANNVSGVVNVQEPQGAWLFYSDAYHVGWRASVDHVRVPIDKAYTAFKTIFIPPGKHEVCFYFFNGVTTVLSYVVAIIGVLAGVIFLALFLATVFRFRIGE